MYRHAEILFSISKKIFQYLGEKRAVHFSGIPLDSSTEVRIPLNYNNLFSGYLPGDRNVFIINSVKNILMALLLRQRYFWDILLQQNRLIMCSKFDLNKAQEELENNPFYSKYSGKIKKMQETDPEEFKKKLEAYEENKKPKYDKTSAKKVIYGEKKGPSVSQTKHTRHLDEIMKTSKLVDKTKEEIVKIWTEFHKSKDVIFGTLSCNVFEIVESYAEKYPTFLLPLPRGEGYEFIVLQFQNNEVHFTPLLSYQAHKADAPECLTLVFYTDLKEDKDIVLMKGDFDKNVLSILEAQCLVNTFHLYYGGKDKKRENLMNTFNNNPDNFRYMDLVAEIESIQLIG